MTTDNAKYIIYSVGLPFCYLENNLQIRQDINETLLVALQFVLIFFCNGSLDNPYLENPEKKNQIPYSILAKKLTLFKHSVIKYSELVYMGDAIYKHYLNYSGLYQIQLYRKSCIGCLNYKNITHIMNSTIYFQIKKHVRQTE